MEKKSKMLCFPNAKINIGLNILDKRSDGFHNLESIFYPIPLCDSLEIIKSKNFQFTTSGLEITGNPDDNLIIKAYTLLREDFDLEPVSIHLHKVIPMGAGLGGGSSDATHTLVLLNQIFELNLTKISLLEYAQKLGSDCPFFIENSPQYVRGRGELLADSKLNLDGYYIKLINPGIHISTAEAFANVKPLNDIKGLDTITKENFESKLDCLQNDFQEGITLLHPKIGEIIEELKDEGAIYVAMTGTGSTVYGVFNSKPIDSKKQNEFVFKLK